MVWICLYTCYIVQAVHLEFVPDLTTDSFLLNDLLLDDAFPEEFQKMARSSMQQLRLLVSWVIMKLCKDTAPSLV